MADGVKIFTGYNDWFPIPTLSPSAPHGMTWELGPMKLAEFPAQQKIRQGGTTITQPRPVPTYANRTGGRLATFFNDYYNRIYVIPLTVDFGPITSDMSIPVQIWNAYYGQSVTLNAVAFDPVQGITVEGPAVPRSFGPLAMYEYTIKAFEEGPANLDTSVVWSFSPTFVFNQPVVGTRVRLLDLDVAWPPSGQTYKVVYSYLTKIEVSRSGKEQRTANRGTPRKVVNYQSQVHHRTFREYKDRMWAWQHRAFALPEVPHYATTSTAMVIGEDSVMLQTVPAWLAVGMQVILRNKALNQQDIRTILAISGTTVTFRSRSGKNWPGGTRLFLGLTGNMDIEVNTPRLTNAVATVDVSFQVTPLSETYNNPPAAPLVFNGREVFLKKPNWATPLSGTFIHEVDILDYERGPRSRFTPVAYGAESRRATYLGKTSAEADAMLDLFRRMKGRQGEFYAPTWEYDFEPKITAPAGSLSLRVAGSSLLDTYGSSTTHKCMFVQLRDGTVLLRRVMSINPVADGLNTDSLIVIDTAWPVDISVNTIVMCGWLLVYRFGSDDLTFEWLTNKAANVVINMVSLEDLPAENP